MADDPSLNSIPSCLKQLQLFLDESRHSEAAKLCHKCLKQWPGENAFYRVKVFCEVQLSRWHSCLQTIGWLHGYRTHPAVSDKPRKRRALGRNPTTDGKHEDLTAKGQEALEKIRDATKTHCNNENCLWLHFEQSYCYYKLGKFNLGLKALSMCQDNLPPTDLMRTQTNAEYPLDARVFPDNKSTLLKAQLCLRLGHFREASSIYGALKLKGAEALLSINRLSVDLSLASDSPKEQQKKLLDEINRKIDEHLDRRRTDDPYELYFNYACACVLSNDVLRAQDYLDVANGTHTPRLRNARTRAQGGGGRGRPGRAGRIRQHPGVQSLPARKAGKRRARQDNQRRPAENVHEVGTGHAQHGRRRPGHSARGNQQPAALRVDPTDAQVRARRGRDAGAQGRGAPQEGTDHAEVLGSRGRRHANAAQPDTRKLRVGVPRGGKPEGVPKVPRNVQGTPEAGGPALPQGGPDGRRDANAVRGRKGQQGRGATATGTRARQKPATRRVPREAAGARGQAPRGARAAPGVPRTLFARRGVQEALLPAAGARAHAPQRPRGRARDAQTDARARRGTRRARAGLGSGRGRHARLQIPGGAEQARGGAGGLRRTPRAKRTRQARTARNRVQPVVRSDRAGGNPQGLPGRGREGSQVHRYATNKRRRRGARGGVQTHVPARGPKQVRGRNTSGNPKRRPKNEPRENAETGNRRIRRAHRTRRDGCTSTKGRRRHTNQSVVQKTTQEAKGHEQGSHTGLNDGSRRQAHDRHHHRNLKRTQKVRRHRKPSEEKRRSGEDR